MMHTMENVPFIVKKTKRGKVTKEILVQILEMYEKGHNQSSIASMVGLSAWTISRLNKSKWFNAQRLQAIAKANGTVQSALFKRATGMQLAETYEVLDKYGNVVELAATKEIPPDVNAQKLWLTNKDPDNWKDKDQALIQINQQLQSVSTSDLLLTLKTGGEGHSPLIESGGAAQSKLNPTTTTYDTPENKEIDAVDKVLGLPEESQDVTPYGRGWDHKYDELLDLKEKVDQVPKEMSDDEYLKSLINDEEYNEES